MASAKRIALIIGAGPGISQAFASELRKVGYEVALASRLIAALLSSRTDIFFLLLSSLAGRFLSERDF